MKDKGVPTSWLAVGVLSVIFLSAVSALAVLTNLLHRSTVRFTNFSLMSRGLLIPLLVFIALLVVGLLVLIKQIHKELVGRY